MPDFESAADVAGFFEDFAEPATFHPAPGGAARAVRVIVSRPSDPISGARVAGLMADAPLAAFPRPPARGDALRLCGGEWRVEEADVSDEGATVRLTLSGPR